MVVNVILGPGCWTNGSGFAGMSIYISLMASRCCQCSWCSTAGVQHHLPFHDPYHVLDDLFYESHDPDHDLYGNNENYLFS